MIRYEVRRNFLTFMRSGTSTPPEWLGFCGGCLREKAPDVALELGLGQEMADVSCGSFRKEPPIWGRLGLGPICAKSRS